MPKSTFFAWHACYGCQLAFIATDKNQTHCAACIAALDTKSGPPRDRIHNGQGVRIGTGKLNTKKGV